MRRSILLGLLLAGLGLVWLSGMLGLSQAWLAMKFQSAAWREDGLWLDDYRVGIEGHAIEGLADNVSGLTYSPPSGTLFTVTNRPPQVAELTVTGDLVRVMPLAGAEDPEGITHVAGRTFIISDEGRQRLDWVEIGPQDTMVDVSETPHLTLDLGAYDNMGFEGVSWDSAGERLVLVQEMWPARVLFIGGLAGMVAGGPLAMEVREWSPSAGRAFMAGDLSSVTLHEATGNLILLSDLSGAMVEYAPSGEVVSVLPLWRGFAGLAAGLPQAEGVAVGPEGEIWIVSEPNLFYRFDRGRPAPWAVLASAP